MLDKVETRLTERSKDIAKETVISVLEDEDIAQGVVAYGDALFQRYSGKFWSSIGGKQKGLNYAIQGATENALPDILDADGMPSLSKIISLGAMKFLSGSLGGGGKVATPSRPIKSPFEVK